MVPGKLSVNYLPGENRVSLFCGQRLQESSFFRDLKGAQLGGTQVHYQSEEELKKH
jgi:hypothetical protein